MNSIIRALPSVVTITALLTLSGCASLYDVNVGGVSGSYWYPVLSGDVSVDLEAFIGDEFDVDLDDTLDLDDEQFPEVRAYASLGPVTIEGTYFQARYDGEQELSQSFTFQGQTFNVGTTVDSTLDLDYGTVKAKIGLVGGGPLALGIIVGVAYVKLEDEISSPALPGVVVGDDLEAPFPVVGGVATFDQPLSEGLRVFAEVEAYGMAVDDFYDVDGHFVDAQARAGLGFGPIKLGAGYRVMDVNVEESTNDDAKFNIRLEGPYVFGELYF